MHERCPDYLSEEGCCPFLANSPIMGCFMYKGVNMGCSGKKKKRK